ncbi:Periplasmic [Fe] hydrogenase large subunit [Caballeronia hypogeia]|uniref:Periplasmic [Fe] hydrogenase large subunit n=1 Tax=Caballeronia hypogeia TaxID=1777140 RepID=A0A158BV13_9BURK|nr:ferredoxin family protein [Caballeronia hypogeia]SAK73087.1 Periplasmic [Fe] hydrogenase large subunit [Caballeronia hypogeia]
MIELIDNERCTGCDICVRVCPTNVFDASARSDGAPVIARQDDCQTCFMCELYCPEDALYVAPQTTSGANVDRAATLTGSYRQVIGWRRGQRSSAADDASYELLSRAH